MQELEKVQEDCLGFEAVWYLTARNAMQFKLGSARKYVRLLCAVSVF